MDKEYSEIIKTAKEKYKYRILPRCRNFEQERIYIQNRAYILTTVFIFSLAIVLFFVLNDFSPKTKIISFLPFLITSLLTGALPKKKDFERRVKKEIMPYFCSCFDNLKWVNCDLYDKSDAKSDFDKKEFFNTARKMLKKSRLPYFFSSTVFEWDDVFVGCYREADFEIIELLSSTSDGKRSIINFSGVVIKIDFNKVIKAHTIILPKDESLLFSDFKKIILEDVEFNKKYSVYSNDEIEARYLITSAFMDRLNNLKTAFNTNKAACAFYDKYLLIAFNKMQDIFEFGTFDKSLLDYDIFSKLLREIISIYKMIDYFKLTDKTKI